jgi:dipeptidyl aminopeptidase/acylaminoacyl peptidase
MICKRSPDGKRIAAVSHPLLAPRSSPAVYVLDLAGIGTHIQKNIPVANVTELAFAPDSRRLALLSKGEYDDFLYLADLEADELRMLASLNKAHSLTWNPTGDQILLISEISRLPGEEDFVIFNAATGEEVRSDQYDPASSQVNLPSPGDPFDTWYDNSSRNGGLEACVALPSQHLTP